MAPVDPHYVWAAGHIIMLTGAGTPYHSSSQVDTGADARSVYHLPDGLVPRNAPEDLPHLIRRCPPILRNRGVQISRHPFARPRMGPTGVR